MSLNVITVPVFSSHFPQHSLVRIFTVIAPHGFSCLIHPLYSLLLCRVVIALSSGSV